MPIDNTKSYGRDEKGEKSLLRLTQKKLEKGLLEANEISKSPLESIKKPKKTY